MLKNRKIAVIGGAGFIGSHLVDHLVGNGNMVLVIDNLSSGKKKNINKNAKFIKFDIRNHWEKLASILLKNKIQYVFHLAADPYIPDSYKRPFTFFNTNATGTMRVLFACQKAKVKRILYYSTSEVYGTVEGKISESTRLNPQSTYAVSKLAGDRLCQTFFKEHKIPVVILRQFNCYGPRESHEYIIPEIISQLNKKSILKLGNVEAKRDFVYVKDAAAIQAELITAGKPGEVYNLGTGKSESIKMLAFMIGKMMQRPFEIKIDKKRLRPHDVNKLEANNTKLRKLLGRLRFVPLLWGLSETLIWFEDNNKKWDYEI